MVLWLLAIAALILAPAASRAACTPDCAGGGTFGATAKSVNAPYCSGNSVTDASPQGGNLASTIRLNFSKNHTCGQYADGSWWIQTSGGAVTVSSINVTGANTIGAGYTANPIGDQHSYDANRGRAGGSNLPWDPPPVTYSSGFPVSFVATSRLRIVTIRNIRMRPGVQSVLSSVRREVYLRRLTA